MMGWGHSLTIEKKAEFKVNFSNALYLCSDMILKHCFI